ncbi:hypothetical protein KOW79_011234 [Hemibagrus wyckioides]|uniref:Uncharacterized protein n=1 Tax=Hemibagrus wyckioides TaxID=337641 RepID=A0A9D3SML0_9TELE|nr:hypothetical protein KOW79_011234 [Hemibagrus wyckioides]
MNLPKGVVDGQVNKVIDQAAGVAKQKIGTMIGGDQKKEKKEAGVGDMISGAIGKAAADQAANQAMDFGKKLFK